MVLPVGSPECASDYQLGESSATPERVQGKRTASNHARCTQSNYIPKDPLAACSAEHSCAQAAANHRDGAPPSLQPRRAARPRVAFAVEVHRAWSRPTMRRRANLVAGVRQHPNAQYRRRDSLVSAPWILPLPRPVLPTRGASAAADGVYGRDRDNSAYGEHAGG